MKSIFAALSILVFTTHASADLLCSGERKDGGMFVKCADGRQGYLDDRIPTQEIIKANYAVKMKNGKAQKVEVKGSQLKDLLNGQYEKNSRYPLSEKLAPFMNKQLKAKYQKSDIVRVEPLELAVSPSIKIYSTTTENGKQKVVKGYGQVEFKDAVPVAAPQPYQRKGTGKTFRANQ